MSDYAVGKPLSDEEAQKLAPPQGYSVGSPVKQPILAGGGAPPTPPPSEQFQVGTPEQQKHWFDQTESYRKIIDTTATMAAAQAVPGVGALSTPLRVAFMGVIGAGADAYGQILSRLLGGKDVPKTSTTAAKEIGGEGIAMAGAELTGVIGGAVLGKMGATAAKAKALLETASKYNMPVSGPEVAGGGVSRTIQSVGQSMLFGKSRFFRMQNQFFAGLNTAAEDTVATFGSQITQERAGEMIQDGFKIAKGKFREMVSPLYEGLISRVEQQTGKASFIDFSKAAKEEGQKIGEEIVEAATKFPSMMKPDSGMMRILRAMYPKVANEIDSGISITGQKIKFPEVDLPKVTLRGAQGLRSMLRDIASDDSDPAAQRLAARSVKVLDGAMRDALEKIPSWSSTATAKAQTPGATFKEELDNIDAAYRKGKELFEGKAYSSLVEKFPEHMAHSVAIGDVTAMRSVHEALVTYAQEPARWDLFRRMWLQDKLGASELTDAQPGQRLAKGITDLSDAFASKAKPMADEFFSDPKGKEVIESLRRLSDLTKTKVGLNVKSDSHLFVNYGILHGMLMIGARMELHALPAVALTAVGPSALVRVMYNKTATNAVVGAMEAAGNAGRVLTDAEIAQIARGVRLAFQTKRAVEEAK